MEFNEKRNPGKGSGKTGIHSDIAQALATVELAVGQLPESLCLCEKHYTQLMHHFSQNVKSKVKRWGKLPIVTGHLLDNKEYCILHLNPMEL